MNWIDGAIVVLILWFTFSAFQAGFIRETVTIVAAILGVILAGLFYQDLADDVLMFIDNETLGRLIAFGILFGATALAGQMLALVLKPTVNLLQLGIFDQLMGAGFGFLKALVFIQIGLILFITYPRWDMDEAIGFIKAMVFVQIFMIVFITYPKWGIDETIDESVFGSLIVEKTAVLVKIMPDEFEISVDTFTGQL